MAGGARVAVLGATGCVGGGVCAAFSAGGHHVIAVARHHTPRASPYAFVRLDVAATPPREIAGIFDAEGVGVVVNATGGWLATEEANRHHHVRLVENLLEGTALMARRPRVVHIGSIHEYGPVPSGMAIDESVEPKPVSPYARTKLEGSEAVLDSEGVVLRAVNVCGPYVTPASFLGTVLGKLREMTRGERLELNIGDARRDFIDVRDLADAVVRAATAPVAGRVINIGRGEAVPIRELLDVLVAAAGFPPDVIKRQPGTTVSRGGDWTLADIRLAGRLLGWSPRIGLRDSMREMWAATA
jgi:nucleoside-diphosphate-sugar epimerase